MPRRSRRRARPRSSVWTSLALGIQDFEHNITRFLVIGRRPLSRAPADKTTIVFTLPNEPGALFKALSVFALRGIDLTKLESRPMPRPGVGVPVLRRHLRRRARGSAVRARAGAPRRVRADAAHARLVSQLQAGDGDKPAAPNSRETRVRPTRIEPADHRRPAARRARAMLKAVGFSDADLRKPLIGVANTWIEIGPCNYHLRDARRAREGRHPRGRRHADGVQHGLDLRRHHDGHQGMRASLVSREVIADSIELVARGNGFDGLVVARRLRQDDSRRASWRSRASNIPGVMLYGGSIAPGRVPRAATSPSRTCSRRSARTPPAA